mmetsp:Transcript_4132/g.14265  ORF Transcript_4132/g.14265 Transcript_4132/m.14265 type:complete len:328 (-) Transcript_4132:2-985(-)
MSVSSSSCTPKFVMADPNSTGVCSPRFSRSRSSGSVRPSSISTSSISCAYSSPSPISASRRSSSSDTTAASSAFLPRSPRAKRCTLLAPRSSTPRNRSPEPTGQSSGQHEMPNSASIWSMSSYGERLGRSSLLTNVKSGSRRSRATSNSLRVWGSSPLAASTSITALSAAASVRYVSSEKSWWPGVSSTLTCLPSYSYESTVLEMEMPRCCSSSMKSEVALRCSPLALTAPACEIAPPYSRSFSVSVVLPASGWLMIARLRRRSTSSARATSIATRRMCRAVAEPGAAAVADGAAAAAQPWVAIVESHMDTESVTSEGERRAPSKAY